MNDVTVESLKIGISLKLLRKQKRITLDSAAKHCGKTSSWLSEIEHGRSEILFRDAQKLCRLYGCEVSDLEKMIKKL